MQIPRYEQAMPEQTSGGPMTMVASGDPFFKNMDLRDATRLLRRRTQLIVSVVIACTILALVIALLLTPLYRAETVVMLEPRQTDVVDIESVVSPLTAGDEVLRSEMDIIQSRAVIDRVMNKLKLTEDTEFNPPPRLFSYLNPSSWFSAELSEEDRAAHLRSIVADNISAKLHVINDGRSYSIHIQFDSKNPKKAALIANTFADEYLVDQLEAKYEATSRANSWLSERLGELKAKVEASEKAVGDFREKTNLINVVDGQTISARQMEDINNQLSEARGATSQAEAKLRSAQAMVRSKAIDGSSDVLASPLIQHLNSEESELRRSQAEMLQKYGPMHPKIQNLQAQMQDLDNKISEEAKKIVQGLANEVEVARSKETELNRQLEELTKRANVEAKDSVALNQLQREVDSNRALYKSFLNRFNETSAEESLQLPDSRIVARADVPTMAAFPKKSLFMLAGMAFGIALGIVIAYLIEYFDRGFRSSAQVEEATGISVIGLIPDLKEITQRAPEDYVVDKPLSSYGEALRTVRTAIHFSNVDHPPKVVMVTSATPGEGKTTTCLSLARALAKTGNRILLIDADLRRSRVALAMGLSDVHGGLSAALTGEKTLAEVTQRDPLVSTLSVIAATGKTPNSHDLLGSHQMQRIVREAAAIYDLVIIDTPPILAVSDAAMVARVCDATIYLVRWSKVSQDLVLQALKQLKTFNTRIAGIVLTQVNLNEHAKYTDSYYHTNYTEYYAN